MSLPKRRLVLQFGPETIQPTQALRSLSHRQRDSQGIAGVFHLRGKEIMASAHRNLFDGEV